MTHLFSYQWVLYASIVMLILQFLCLFGSFKATLCNHVMCMISFILNSCISLNLSLLRPFFPPTSLVASSPRLSHIPSFSMSFTPSIVLLYCFNNWLADKVTLRWSIHRNGWIYLPTENHQPTVPAFTTSGINDISVLIVLYCSGSDHGASPSTVPVSQSWRLWGPPEILPTLSLRATWPRPELAHTRSAKVSSLHLVWAKVGHDGVIKWKQFPCYWPFVRGIHRSPVNSPH